MSGSEVEVDGTGVAVPEGASLLSAVRAAGIELPALCSDDRLSPAGSCRTCLVRADGTIVAACVSPAAPGAHVETATDDLRQLRRDAVQLIASVLPRRALTGDNPSELAHACQSLGLGPETAQGAGGRGGDGQPGDPARRRGHRPRVGVTPLRGQNNVQGASDMGALPDLLPGYGKVTDPAARARAEAVWRVPVPERPGLRIPDMFAAARAGNLRALWVIGEDVCATAPDSKRVAAALDGCPLVVCNELFLSETARHSDIVLPVASWLEKDGTFVNFDRCFQRVRPAVLPPGEARSDFDTVNALAAAMGVDLGCLTPADALAECGRFVPVFAGLSHDRLDWDGAVPWPCPDPSRPGEAKLYEERFATPDGRAHLAAPAYLLPGEHPDAEYPLLLVTGRRWAHYNSGSMTRRGGNLALDPVDFLDLHPDDAARYGVRDGTQLTVESRHGRARLIARVSEQTAPGQVFSSFHFPPSGVNRLTSDQADTVTSCPEYKVTAVRVGVR